MKNILLTGATGFVGSNLARRLIRDGHKVNILSRSSSDFWRLKDIYGKLNIHEVDLLEKEKLENIIKEIKPEYIIHTATYGGRPLQKETDKIITSNFLGLMNLVEACNTIPYKCFINTGSSSEYGPKSEKMKESDICEPITAYGVSKVASALYCNYISRENKNIGTLRLFSPFGDYEEKGRLFPDVILNALEEKPIYLANPNSVRDFIYIEDVVELYLKILKNPADLKGEIYNCGYGEQHSVEYIVNKVIEITGSKSEIKYNTKAGREFETEKWTSDISKAKKKFSWELNNSFDEGIKKAVDWFQNNKNLYK